MARPPKVVTALALCLLIGNASGASQQPAADTGAASGIDYVALGDSMPTTAEVAGTPYPTLYAEYLASDLGQEVRLNNAAVPGSTSADLLASLQAERPNSLSSVVAEAEVVTLQISYNDFAPAASGALMGECAALGDLSCDEEAFGEARRNLKAIVLKLVSLRDPSETIFRLLNYGDPFPENPVLADEGFPSDHSETIRPVLSAWNEFICKLAERNEMQCADVYTAFNGSDRSQSPFQKGFISHDGEHLTDEGHEAIAEELAMLGYEPLG